MGFVLCVGNLFDFYKILMSSSSTSSSLLNKNDSFVVGMNESEGGTGTSQRCDHLQVV